MDERRVKTPDQSKIEMTELVLPNDTNWLNNLLGGKMLHWIDIAGALAGSKHSNSKVATVAIERVEFRRPIRVGDMVILIAKLVYAGNTSMDIKVDVFSENLQTGERLKTNKAYLTFVALDEREKPVIVPLLKPETEEEIAEYLMAEQKRNERIQKKQK